MSKLAASRKFQLWGILFIAFFFPVVGALAMLNGFEPPPPTRGAIAAGMLWQLGTLGLLWFALRSQKRSFTDIGFSFLASGVDLRDSVLLFLGAYFVFEMAHGFFFHLATFLQGHPPERWDKEALLFGAKLSFVAFLAIVVNPFHEELLVRAYMMTEVDEVYQSRSAALVGSVFLQASYHLYQGIPNALAWAGAFSVFAFYFQMQRRALPVVLAHLYMDALAFTLYARSLHT